MRNHFTDLSDAEVFRRGADYIRRYGWTKKRFYDDDGRVCAWGALATAANPGLMEDAHTWNQNGSLFYRHYRGYFDRAVAQWGDAGDFVASTYAWNDCVAQSAEDVIQLFEQIADDLESGMAKGLESKVVDERIADEAPV